MDVPKTIQCKCPTCTSSIHVPFMRAATTIVRRTCRRCKTKVQIKAQPREINTKLGAMWVTQCELLVL